MPVEIYWVTARFCCRKRKKSKLPCNPTAIRSPFHISQDDRSGSNLAHPTLYPINTAKDPWAGTARKNRDIPVSNPNCLTYSIFSTVANPIPIITAYTIPSKGSLKDFLGQAYHRSTRNLLPSSLRATIIKAYQAYD